MDKLKELIRKQLKEMSATNQGGASFTPGEGANYAPPVAFNKNKKAKGAKNIYYYKLGYKPVPNIKPKSYDKKKLWEEEGLEGTNDFQKKRLAAMNDIENLMKEINPLISNAKNNLNNFITGNPGSYNITEPVETVKGYLQDIKKILTKEVE